MTDTPAVEQPVGDARSLGKTPVRLTIGMDFGTSTIKCMISYAVAERGARQWTVVPIDGLDCFPSAVWESRGRFFMGTRPSTGAAKTYRSVKACLRCGLIAGEPCRRCFEASSLSAEAVSWALLSYCCNRARDYVASKFPGFEYSIDWGRDVEWNMGVPLDGMEQESLRVLFRDLLWRAVHYGEAIDRQRMEVADVVSAYNAIRTERCPSPQSSNCFVFPEAHVAVTAFRTAERNLEAGLYFICDAGAGTTDITFFRYAPQASRQIVFYGSACTRIGGYHFAVALADHLGWRTGVDDPEEAILRASATLEGGLEHVDLGDVDHVGRPHIFAACYEMLCEGRRCALGRAAEKEKPLWPRWRNLAGTVIGGGSLIPGVVKTCTERIRTGGWKQDIVPDHVSLRLTKELGKYQLHGIAYGLSVPAAYHEDYWRPDVQSPIGQIPGLVASSGCGYTHRCW